MQLDHKLQENIILEDSCRPRKIKYSIKDVVSQNINKNP
jgi:hypothetical protein